MTVRGYKNDILVKHRTKNIDGKLIKVDNDLFKIIYFIEDNKFTTKPFKSTVIHANWKIPRGKH